MKILPALTKDTMNSHVEWRGEKIGFSAYRDVLSPSLMKRFTAVEADPMEIAYALAGQKDEKGVYHHGVLKTWEIEDVDCCDAAAVGRLPLEFLSLFVEKIGETWSGEKKSSETLVLGSAA